MKKIKIYSQKRVKKGNDKGWLFVYALPLSSTAISTEKEEEIWIEDKKEAYEEFMCRKSF
jgi:hypothetical protein